MRGGAAGDRDMTDERGKRGLRWARDGLAKMEEEGDSERKEDTE